MSLFGAIVRTAVNVAVLPLSVAADTVLVVADAAHNTLAPRTRAAIERLKRESGATR